MKLIPKNIPDIGDELEEEISFIYFNPFGNCQIISIAYFCDIVRLFDHKKHKDLKIIFDSLKKLKRQAMIDVSQSYVSTIKQMTDYFEIVFKQDYNNLTGSKMCMMLIKFK